MPLSEAGEGNACSLVCIVKLHGLIAHLCLIVIIISDRGGETVNNVGSISLNFHFEIWVTDKCFVCIFSFNPYNGPWGGYCDYTVLHGRKLKPREVKEPAQHPLGFYPKLWLQDLGSQSMVTSLPVPRGHSLRPCILWFWVWLIHSSLEVLQRSRLFRDVKMARWQSGASKEINFIPFLMGCAVCKNQELRWLKMRLDS